MATKPEAVNGWLAIASLGVVALAGLTLRSDGDVELRQELRRLERERRTEALRELRERLDARQGPERADEPSPVESAPVDSANESAGD